MGWRPPTPFTRRSPTLGNQISLEAVQEFQVLSENYSAVFGPAKGGVINAVTHHGSNQFHGSGYEYFANNSLSASDKFALGHSLFGHQNQAGGTIGGPVIHNKIFFFGNFEVLDATGQGLNLITSPLLDSTARPLPPPTAIRRQPRPSARRPSTFCRRRTT